MPFPENRAMWFRFFETRGAFCILLCSWFVSELRDWKESIRLNLLIWLFQCICASVFGLPDPSGWSMLNSPPCRGAVHFPSSWCQFFLYEFRHFVLRSMLYLTSPYFWWMLFSISLYPSSFFSSLTYICLRLILLFQLLGLYLNGPCLHSLIAHRSVCGASVSCEEA